VEIFGTPEVELYRKWICIICVIEMLGSMLGPTPEMVKQGISSTHKREAQLEAPNYLTAPMDSLLRLEVI